MATLEEQVDYVENGLFRHTRRDALDDADNA